VCCVYGGLWFVGRSYNPKRTALLKLTMYLANIPTTLAPFTTFLVYEIIAAVKKDETVLSAQAFASLSLISLLTSPLLTFCQALPTFFQAVSCFDRIDAYLSKQPASFTVFGISTRPNGARESWATARVYWNHHFFFARRHRLVSGIETRFTRSEFSHSTRFHGNYRSGCSR
jgi:hypothetical protein